MKYQDFSFYKKIISSPCAVKILFLSFTCEDIDVAMVTNFYKTENKMISIIFFNSPLQLYIGVS